MDTLKYLLVLLLFPLSVFALDDPLTTRSDLRGAVYNQLNQSTSGTDVLTTTVVNEAVNRAQLKVCADFNAVPRESTFVCSDGVAAYSVDAAFSRLLWATAVKVDENYVIRALEVVPAEQIYKIGQKGRSEVEELDEPDYIYSWSGNVYLYPAPDYADTVHYGYTAVAAELSSDADTTQIIYEYREAVVYWACAICAMRMGDYQLSQQYRQWYGELLNISMATGKEKAVEGGK